MPEIYYEEQRWDNRPVCVSPDCTEPALSLSGYCWEHLPESQRNQYLTDLEDRSFSIDGFAGFNLSGVNLREARLSRVNMSGANLTGADLSGAELIGANLSDAILVGANLSSAQLVKADLYSADMEGANLRRANLTSANVELANCRGVDFTGAAFKKTDVVNSDLSDCVCDGADFSRAIIFRAALLGASFDGASFEGARLEGCAVAAADFTGADLYGSVIHDTDVGAARLAPDLTVVNERREAFAEAAEVYAKLKVAFREYGRYDLAEKVFYREKICRRKNRWRFRRVGLLPAAARHVLEYLFFDVYSGYGTKPWRIAYCMAAGWFAFAMYFYLLPFFGTLFGFGPESYIDPGGGVPPITDLSLESFGRSLYFSFVTITALGFTHYEPYGWAKTLAGLERSFGIISYIVLIFSIGRKIWH
jgi:uncharacterized protein YjbI with pentapeptide repeats